MPEYNRIDFFIPEPLVYQANQLFMAFGSHIADGDTVPSETDYVLLNDQTMPVYMVSNLFEDDYLANITGDGSISIPDHAPNLDVAAAEEARSKMIFEGPAEIGKILVVVNMSFSFAISESGVKEITL